MHTKIAPESAFQISEISDPDWQVSNNPLHFLLVNIKLVAAFGECLLAK